jgi:hypothetical protein
LPPSNSRWTACALNSLVKLRRVRLSAMVPSWVFGFLTEPSTPRGEAQPLHDAPARKAASIDDRISPYRISP